MEKFSFPKKKPWFLYLKMTVVAGPRGWTLPRTARSTCKTSIIHFSETSCLLQRWGTYNLTWQEWITKLLMVFLQNALAPVWFDKSYGPLKIKGLILTLKTQLTTVCLMYLEYHLSSFKQLISILDNDFWRQEVCNIKADSFLNRTKI